MRRRFVALLAVIGALTILTAVPASADGAAAPPSGTFYVDGEVYRTVVTPTSIPDRGPFDTLYVFPDCATCAPVSDAAPGVGQYNGGRWMVVQAFGIDHQLTSAADVEAYASSLVDTGVRFVCPMIRAA